MSRTGIYTVVCIYRVETDCLSPLLKSQAAKKRVEALKAAQAARHPAAKSAAGTAKPSVKGAAPSKAAAVAASAVHKITIGEDDDAAKKEIDDYFQTLDAQACPHPSLSRGP